MTHEDYIKITQTHLSISCDYAVSRDEFPANYQVHLLLQPPVNMIGPIAVVSRPASACFAPDWPDAYKLMLEEAQAKLKSSPYFHVPETPDENPN